MVDIRQPYELGSGYIPNSLLIPMNQLASQVDIFPKDVPIVLYCAAGARSFGMAHFMREKGFDQAWSMIGGVGEWSTHSTHPSHAKYSLFQEEIFKGITFSRKIKLIQIDIMIALNCGKLKLKQKRKTAKIYTFAMTNVEF